MATFMNTDCVKYQFKGISAHISELSFCRHCLELKSKQCVLHEVDSLFCPNCLESVPIGEAIVRKNRCATCFNCASCGNSLSTRATTIQPDTSTKAPPSGENPVGENQTPEKPKTLKKAFYLACSYCRWTSRDVQIKDQSVASGGWSDQLNPHSTRIASLVEYYKQLTMDELQDKERKKLRKKSYFVDKVGLGQLSFKRRTGFSLSLIKDHQDSDISTIEPSKASDTFEELPQHYFTKAPNLAAITTMKQRLSKTEFQPASVSQLHPQRKHLLIKRSQRCKGCEHNLSKPEYNPSAIKFKIQLVAIHHIPELRVLKIPLLKPNQPTRLILTINNPLEILLRIQLTTLDNDTGADDNDPAKAVVGGDDDDTAKDIVGVDDDDPAKSVVGGGDGGGGGVKKEIDSGEDRIGGDDNDVGKNDNGVDDDTDKVLEGKAVKGTCTAKIQLPTSELQINKCDEAAEMDESPIHDDDPDVIAFRKGNKIGFYVTIVPVDDGGDVVVRMKMKHNYVKRVLPVGVTATASGSEKEAKEDEVLWLEHGIILNLGKMS